MFEPVPGNLGLVYTWSSQSGTLSPAENPQSFPLFGLLHLAQPKKSGPGGTKAWRRFISLLCLQEERVCAGAFAGTQTVLSPSDLMVSVSLH